MVEAICLFMTQSGPPGMSAFPSLVEAKRTSVSENGVVESTRLMPSRPQRTTDASSNDESNGFQR